MKKLAIFSLILMITSASCKTFYPVNDTANESLLITVDCRNEAGLKQSIVMLMRVYKARDLKVTNDLNLGETLTISAAFLKKELTQGKLTELMQDIEKFSGVIESRVEDNHRAIMQVSDFVPAVR